MTKVICHIVKYTLKLDRNRTKVTTTVSVPTITRSGLAKINPDILALQEFPRCLSAVARLFATWWTRCWAAARTCFWGQTIKSKKSTPKEEKQSVIGWGHHSLDYWYTCPIAQPYLLPVAPGVHLPAITWKNYIILHWRDFVVIFWSVI